MRWTEEEAIAAGWKRDKDGNWCPPRNAIIAGGRGSARQRANAFVQRNDPGEVPELESTPQRKKRDKVCPDRKNAEGCGRSSQFRIVVTARYRRHVDPDNIAPKWFVDSLVRAGILPSDSSEFVGEFVKRVVKVDTWEPETTTIEVWRVK